MSPALRAMRATRFMQAVLPALLVFALASCELNLDPLKGTLSGSPLDDLPPHIRPVSATGMRPVWAPDGEHIAYLDGNLGDVHELTLSSGKDRVLTEGFTHAGFTRAHYTPGGDLILCGPESLGGSGELGRFAGVMWYFAEPFDRAPTPLDAPCWEGIAVSRAGNAVAWADSDVDFGISDPLLLILNLLNARSDIWVGEIARDASGTPQLTGRRRVLTRGDISDVAVMEPQDFRPPGNGELVVSVYAHNGTEVYGVDLVTGRRTNYSRSPLFYEEPEGISPDGTWILVERTIGIVLFPAGLDIWSLSLDGRATYKRLTDFTRHKGFGASNPTVSPDGTQIVFQLSVVTDEADETGQGDGILIYDLEAAPGGST